GFGFVELADGSGDAFLHIGVVQAAGHDDLAPETKLRIQVGQGPKGRQVISIVEIRPSDTVGFRPGRTASPRNSSVDPTASVSLEGTVKWFRSEKGFGFVVADDGGKDVFIHVSILERARMSSVSEGQRVSMRVASTPKGREAVSVKLI